MDLLPQILSDLWLNLCNLQLGANPIKEIPGPVFLVGYIVGMLGLPLLMGRQAAGVVLLLVGGYKAFLGFSHGRPVCFLVILLVVTIFTHLAELDGSGSRGGCGSSCSGGGFFFFGGGGCGSSCGGGCGSSCGGGCGGGCGGCG